MRTAIAAMAMLLGAVLLASCKDDGPEEQQGTSAATATATVDATATVVAWQAERTAAALATITPTPVTVIAQATPPAQLKPPDSEASAAPCVGPTEELVVTIRINPDVPVPRCARVRPEQRIQFVNNLSRPARIMLGPFDETMEPRHKVLFDMPAGSYLAPGVHVPGSSVPTGRAALWVIEGEH